MREYLNELSRAKYKKRLSRAEEVELATKARAGDISARNTLVEMNLPFALSRARKFVTFNLGLDDLVSATHEGLIKAADRYDPASGVKFITYAVHYIKASIVEEFESNKVIYTPRGRDYIFPVSIDQPVAGTEDMSMSETIEYEQLPVDIVLHNREFRERLEKLILSYDVRVQEVMNAYYGITDEYVNLHDLEVKYNVTGEALRRIRNITIQKIKKELC